jgi:hypothetical protein
MSPAGALLNLDNYAYYATGTSKPALSSYDYLMLLSSAGLRRFFVLYQILTDTCFSGRRSSAISRHQRPAFVIIVCSMLANIPSVKKHPNFLDASKPSAGSSFSPFLLFSFSRCTEDIEQWMHRFLARSSFRVCVVKRSISRSLHQDRSLDSASDLLRRCVNHTDLRSMLNAIIHLSIKSPFLPFSLKMLMYAMSQTWHN